MVMQADILYSPVNDATSATGGGSMETKGGDTARASVTVIIPTYRRPDVLPRAISSAQRQTLKPAQILVVDDGSGDHSAEVAASFPTVTVLQQPNAGAANARNLGLRSCTSDYVASLDHDDAWDEGFLQAAVDALKAHQADVAWVNFRQKGKASFRNYLRKHRHLARLLGSSAHEGTTVVDHGTAVEFFLFSNGAASNSALVYRREALGSGWDPDTEVADDLRLLARLLLKKRPRCVFLWHPLWTKHEDDGGFSLSSESTVRKCLRDHLAIAQLVESNLPAQAARRWSYKTGDLRYKLAYHCLWDSNARTALEEARGAFREVGVTNHLLQLLALAFLRKSARVLRLRGKNRGASAPHLILQHNEETLTPATSDSPWLSIIIPVFEAAAKLSGTLQSIRLHEAPGVEIIIVDGSSCPKTAAVAGTYQVAHPNSLRLIAEPDTGIYDAMNKGIRQSRGDWLYFLGAGDHLLPGSLMEIQRHLPQNKRALCYGSVLWSGKIYDGPFTAAKLCWYNICHQAIFYSRQLFESLGHYDLRYPACADWEFNLRCYGTSNIPKVYIPVTVAEYESGGRSSLGDAAFERDRWKLALKHLGVITTAKMLVRTGRHKLGAVLRKLLARNREHISRASYHNCASI
ncbi:glycosyl transferase family 2 [Roseimicrobium gellanilyticum]|uniref:Glycosyl transferase family 2 n=1 Tax=Roseimicrobium gellanilyticum TaxID=748857 RepID=A0A366HW37_9BACT|nr:glycosyltransferase [Roseimicrobium gellanilyticum]RBP48130.1 glycosyl transferase family 2 [Roseimicrobium gellanilyticum]